MTKDEQRHRLQTALLKNTIKAKNIKYYLKLSLKLVGQLTS